MKPFQIEQGRQTGPNHHLMESAVNLTRVVEGNSPMLPPTAGWVFDPGHAVIWVVMALFIGLRVVRDRGLSDFALVFFGATSGFWIEWTADWACYLIYNPQFALMPWESQWYMTPYKPWAVPFGYGVFFATGIPMAQWMIRRVAASRPGWSRAKVIAVVALPTFYVFDVIAEGVMTKLGWYSYTSPVPPAFYFEKGSFSIIHPAILFTFWACAYLWLIDRPVVGKPNRIETWLGIRGLGGGVGAEIGRLLAWCLTFQFTLFVAFCVVGVGLRMAFGSPSVLVP